MGTGSAESRLSVDIKQNKQNAELSRISVGIRASRAAFSVFLSGLFLLLALVSLPSSADDRPQQSPNRSKGVRKGRGPKVQSRSSEGQELKSTERPPDMPGVSLPNGKFVYGFNTGKNMGARFEVPDSPSSLLGYYKTALKNSGWKVAEQGIKPNQVVASHQQLKSSLTITTMASSKPGCQVYFSYGQR